MLPQRVVAGRCNLATMSARIEVDLRQLLLGCCSPLAAHARSTLTKRSCSYGGSLRSSTVVVSTAAAAAGGNPGGAVSSLRRQHRCNGFHSASSAVVPLRTLGHPGQNLNNAGHSRGSGNAVPRVPIYA